MAEPKKLCTVCNRLLKAIDFGLGLCATCRPTNLHKIPFPPAPTKPTKSHPGSQDRQAVYAARVAANLPVLHVDDYRPSIEDDADPSREERLCV